MKLVFESPVKCTQIELYHSSVGHFQLKHSGANESYWRPHYTLCAIIFYGFLCGCTLNCVLRDVFNVHARTYIEKPKNMHDKVSNEKVKRRTISFF